MEHFTYLAAESVAEALTFLRESRESGASTVVMAGGTDVVPALKRSGAMPGCVLHVGGLEELRYIRRGEGALHIGAATTHAELASSPLLDEEASALARAAANSAGPAVRNLATIGGNLATASPAGDVLLAAAALGGRVVVRSLRGERRLTVDEFVVGMKQTALADDELIVEVVIPLPEGARGSGFHKLGKRKAMAISTASAAAAVVLSADGAVFENVTVTLGSLGPTVIHSAGFEEALRGRPATLEEIERWRHLAGGDACPSPRQRRAGAWYRCEVAAVLAARAVEDALAQAVGLDLSAHRAAVRKRGKGIAGCIYSSTAPGVPNPCAVNMQMREDGSVVVQTGACDIGQGSTTVIAMMAAEALTIPYEHVSVYTADTGTTPYDLGTASSRLTFAGGNAVLKVAAQIKAVLLQAASAKLGVSADDLVLEAGRVRHKYDAGRFLSVADAARFAHYTLKTIPMASGYYYPKSSAPDENMQGDPIASFYYHATAAEVEVDVETGVVDVTKLCAAVDCGKAINPAFVEGQVQGGAMQAVGWALREDPHPGLTSVDGPPEDYDPDNMPLDFESYGIATAMDLPELHGTYVEVPDPEGPFGAKAAGEIVANSGAPAVFNAIYDAVGVRLLEMPATPEKVLWALKHQDGCGAAVDEGGGTGDDGGSAGDDAGGEVE